MLENVSMQDDQESKKNVSVSFNTWLNNTFLSGKKPWCPHFRNKHHKSALLDAPVVDKNMIKCPLLLPTVQENVIKSPLGCSSCGGNVMQCHIGCTTSSKMSCPLGKWLNS